MLRFVKTLNGRLPPEDSSVRPQTLGKRISDDPRHFDVRGQKRQKFVIVSTTLNGRLPPEDSSDWPETWPKRVSDDPRHFIFRPPKLFLVEHVCAKMCFLVEKKHPPLLGELRQTSQDICDSDSDSNKSWDVRLSS